MTSGFSLLRNKTSLITGAGRGIGKAIAKTFAANGAHLLLNARTGGSIDALCRELSQEHNISCTPVYFDVSVYEEVKQAFREIARSGKPLDVVVNNAGIMKDTMLGILDPAMVQEVFSVNTFGSLYVMQYASRLMMKEKKGSIINLSSLVGLAGNEGQAVYAGSKAAIVGITRSAARELAPYGVRVNAVAPGFIETDMTAGITGEKRKKVLGNIRMKRAGTPEEVADCCLFLASDLSRYITGQVIGVDGGMELK